uniref:Putative secreted protein n=1 Tax=Anopheles darlingi TaxID=43151 RepID=A0A2M4DDD1_ANODA
MLHSECFFALLGALTTRTLSHTHKEARARALSKAVGYCGANRSHSGCWLVSTRNRSAKKKMRMMMAMAMFDEKLSPILCDVCVCVCGLCVCVWERNSNPSREHVLRRNQPRTIFAQPLHTERRNDCLQKTVRIEKTHYTRLLC